MTTFILFEDKNEDGGRTVDQKDATMSTQPEIPLQKKPSLLHLAGIFCLILGATLLGMFITRQLKETGTGHTYYEFIAGGVLLTVIGVAIIAGTRRKPQ